VTALRKAYVTGVRTARRAAEATGLLGALSRRSSNVATHLRSMFAIYDPIELAAMDLVWWSYPAIRRVDEFLQQRANARVFEFGAGASTAWLGRRADEVHSAEHDTDFAEHMHGLLAGLKGVTLHVVPPTPSTSQTVVRSERKGYEGLDFGEYVDTIDRVGGIFDLVIIDGRARVKAFERALEHLAPNGLVVFDNINRTRYRHVLRRPGLRWELLRGATPSLPYPTTTALATFA
jgi:hypothetical protein